MKFEPKDITGQKYGMLTAICRTSETRNGGYKWLCKCDCGNETVVDIGNLRKSGGTQSCGCKSNEARKKTARALHEKAVERKRIEMLAKAERKEIDFAERFEERHGIRFEYIGGYPSDDITVKCKRCGREKEIKRKKIFESGRNIACVSCGDNRYKNKGKDSLCTECGMIFTQYAPCQTLCEECHKEKERAKQNAWKRIREARAVTNGKVDYSITLARLIERDNHICQLCGREVNESDYIYVGDVFVAGNDYPSIDHIQPLSKGGVHQWDNVQLAHRLCNSIKRDK